MHQRLQDGLAKAEAKMQNRAIAELDSNMRMLRSSLKWLLGDSALEIDQNIFDEGFYELVKGIISGRIDPNQKPQINPLACVVADNMLKSAIETWVGKGGSDDELQCMRSGGR